MAAETGTKHLTLKLLVDTKNEVVLFAEAGKDVVDFIFHLLALPIGTVISLLTKTAMVGSLGNLYDSVETLDNTYLESSGKNNNKDILLKPKTPTYGGGSFETLLLPAANSTAADSIKPAYYSCESGCQYVTQNTSATCPGCHDAMGTAMTLVEAQAPAAGTAVQSSSGGGYVKGVVTYMVMDNLVEKPMSTISSITLLNKFNVMDLNALEEKVVDFRYEEGVKLLKASMESTHVLTSVFLGGKKRAAPIPAPAH